MTNQIKAKNRHTAWSQWPFPFSLFNIPASFSFPVEVKMCQKRNHKRNGQKVDIWSRIFFFVIQTGTKRRPRCSCEGVVHLRTSKSLPLPRRAPNLPSPSFGKRAARVQVNTRAMRGRDAAARCRAAATNCCEPIWTVSQVRPRSHRAPQSESDRPGPDAATACVFVFGHPLPPVQGAVV